MQWAHTTAQGAANTCLRRDFYGPLSPSGVSRALSYVRVWVFVNNFFSETQGCWSTLELETQGFWSTLELA